MIFVQAFGTFLQRDETRSSQYSSLSHASAKSFAINARLLDELFRTHQQRADRPAQSLGQAEHHGIELLRDLRHRLTKSNRRIENPSPVEVHWDPDRARSVAYFIRHRLRIHRSARHVVR